LLETHHSQFRTALMFFQMNLRLVRLAVLQQGLT
jgi:hypothetical protein